MVGDLAQFMVQNNLSGDEVKKNASTLSFPSSVVEYFQGQLGIPPFGFPEEFRAKVVAGKILANGKEKVDGRPGAEMSDFDFDSARERLSTRFGAENIGDAELLSYAQYPKIFEDYMKHKYTYGDVCQLDTRTFVEGMDVRKIIFNYHCDFT